MRLVNSLMNSKLTSPGAEHSYELEVRGADYYHELLDTLYDLVEKETATTPDGSVKNL